MDASDWLILSRSLTRASRAEKLKRRREEMDVEVAIARYPVTRPRAGVSKIE